MIFLLGDLWSCQVGNCSISRNGGSLQSWFPRRWIGFNGSQSLLWFTYQWDGFWQFSIMNQAKWGCQEYFDSGIYSFFFPLTSILLSNLVSKVLWRNKLWVMDLHHIKIDLRFRNCYSRVQIWSDFYVRLLRWIDLSQEPVRCSLIHLSCTIKQLHIQLIGQILHLILQRTQSISQI